MSADIDVSAFVGWKFKEHIEMYSEDFSLCNTWDNQGAILPTVNQSTKFENGKVSADLKRLSWSVFRFTK